MQLVVLHISSWRGRKTRPDLAAQVQTDDTGRVSVVEDLAGDSLRKIRSATVRAYETHSRLSWPGPTGRWVHDAHLDRWLTAMSAESRHWHECLRESTEAYAEHYAAASPALQSRMLHPDTLGAAFSFRAYHLPPPEADQQWQEWRRDCLASAMAELPERLVSWLSKIIDTAAKRPQRAEALIGKIMPDIVAAADVAEEAGDAEAISLMRETQDILLSGVHDDRLTRKCQMLLERAKALAQQHEEG